MKETVFEMQWREDALEKGAKEELERLLAHLLQQESQKADAD